MRALLRLWFCTLTQRHDWWTFGGNNPYGWRRCSLCHTRAGLQSGTPDPEKGS